MRKESLILKKQSFEIAKGIIGERKKNSELFQYENNFNI